MNIKDRNPEKKEWTIEIRPKKRLLERSMVISGFILYVCKTGYYNCLQTNNIGTFMVPYTTYTNNYHVYVCIRRISWDIYRWSSTITFLYVRNFAVELF